MASFKRKRKKFLGVRVSPAAFQRVREYADVYQATRAEFLRDLIEAFVLENPSHSERFFARMDAARARDQRLLDLVELPSDPARIDAVGLQVGKRWNYQPSHERPT